VAGGRAGRTCPGLGARAQRRTEALLQAQPGYEATPQRHPARCWTRASRSRRCTRRGAWLYNLWRDAEHPRGLWRRTTLAEYRKAAAGLGNGDRPRRPGQGRERENWVWGGATCLGPAYRRCLVQLSRGGADATVVREFDTVDKRFVAGGFQLPEAKTSSTGSTPTRSTSATDFGPGSLTDSGYPRVIKRWQRGQPLGAGAHGVRRPEGRLAVRQVDHTPGFERTVFGRSTGFYNTEQHLLLHGRPGPIDKPRCQLITFWRERVLLEAAQRLDRGGRTWPRGSLLVADAAAYLPGSATSGAVHAHATRSLDQLRDAQHRCC
jgi:prolyl oligopeptidase